MVFLKRNLFWIIGGVISAGLLAGAWIFMSGANEKRDTALGELEQYTNVVNRLASTSPYPSREMIDKINRDTVAVKSFTTNAESLFRYRKPQRMPSQQFKVHLINALVALQSAATNYNVVLPANFNFTFKHLLPMPNLLPYSIEPLSIQLRDIQEIAQILFESRVHSIHTFSREPAYAREPGGAVLMYDVATRTNLTTDKAVFTSTPYRFSFSGFTTELTEVLNRFARAKRFYVVKKIEVSGTRSADIDAIRAKALASGAANMMGGGIEDDASGGSAGGLVRAVQPSLLAAQRAAQLARMRAAANRRGVVQAPQLQAVVDERPLRIEMMVDVVKLIEKPQAPTGGQPGGPPGGPPGPPNM